MDYNELTRQIKSLEGAKVIGLIETSDGKYPFFQIIRGKGKKVLLSGAVHGDEPAGVYAIIEFFLKHSYKYIENFEFSAFPCVNPWGFQNSKRGNSQGLNLNREFKRETISREISFIMELLENYVFTMDLHETWPDGTRIGIEPVGEDPGEFFLWETCEDKSLRIGHKIIKNIESIGIPICRWQNIYGDKNNNGVIWYPENCGTPCYSSGISFDSYLARNHTRQAFTIESPRDLPIEQRVLSHIVSIKTALDEKL